MAEHIDRFLLELREELPRELPYAQRVEQLAELRMHLQEKRDALTEIGLDPTEAELEAIRSFGKPEVVAAKGGINLYPVAFATTVFGWSTLVVTWILAIPATLYVMATVITIHVLASMTLRWQELRHLRRAMIAGVFLSCLVQGLFITIPNRSGDYPLRRTDLQYFISEGEPKPDPVTVENQKALQVASDRVRSGNVPMLSDNLYAAPYSVTTDKAEAQRQWLAKLEERSNTWGSHYSWLQKLYQSAQEAVHDPMPGTIRSCAWGGIFGLLAAFITVVSSAVGTGLRSIFKRLVRRKPRQPWRSA